MPKQSLSIQKSGLGHKEYHLLKRLNTPAKVQNFVNSLKFNQSDTHRSVSKILKYKEAHCFEGALVGAVALWINGYKPLLLDLKAPRPDFDHVVALFKIDNRWGAISKTNHAVLRYREPVYKSVRELALSYFHEYFLRDGKKTLREFSKPFDLSKVPFDTWIIGEENLAWLAEELDRSPHEKILTPKQIRNLRRADGIEIKAGNIKEYL